MNVSPNSLSMGPGDGATLAASENGYNGSYSSSDDCAGIVTVDQSNHGQFSVSAIAPGLCTITISDTQGHSVPVSVSVQTVVIGGG